MYIGKVVYVLYGNQKSSVVFGKMFTHKLKLTIGFDENNVEVEELIVLFFILN